MYKKFKMLVMDDEKDLVQLMSILLKNSDAEIISALSLTHGKKLWEKNIPTIVLLDNNFPDGMGVEMIESNPQLLQNCKVIMVTADAQKGLKKRATVAGIHYFIQKPFGLKVIRELMNEIISHQA